MSLLKQQYPVNTSRSTQRPSALRLVRAARQRQRERAPGLLERWQAWRRQRHERLTANAADRVERQRRRALQAELEEDAYFFMDRIVHVTERMANLSYRYKKNERDTFESRVQTIEFTDFVLQPEAIYLKLDTVRLPRNVSLQDLADESALFNMSMACGHKVLCEYSEERGFYYIIERTSGVRGIPLHVRLDEMWSMRGPTHDGLSIPFGVAENKKPVWRSLNQMLSLLIAGTPGSGKSNLINLTICTYIRFNSPARVKLAMVDLKGGNELGPYSEIPHLMRYKPLPMKKGDALEPEQDGDPDEAETLIQNTTDEEDAEMIPALVERREEVLPLVRAIYKEGRRRQGLLRKAGVRNIGNYNWRNPKRALPHLVLIIDELAELQLLSAREFASAQILLTSIAQLFRNVGIHIATATQTPTKEVISQQMRNAIPGRIAFACPSVTASTLIIGDGRATGLSPQGRGILDWNGRQIEIQTPYMPDRLIASVIQGAIRGEYEEFELKRHDVAEEEIFRAALEEFAGELPADQMYRWFNNRQRLIPRQEVRNIIGSYIGKQVMIGSTVYRVCAGSGGKPPSLEAIEEEKVK